MLPAPPHGACRYFQVAINNQILLTAPGSLLDSVVQQAAGSSVNHTDLVAAFRGDMVPLCNADCELTEAWFCYQRDISGSPTVLLVCSEGIRALDSCAACPEISIPDYNEQVVVAAGGVLAPAAAPSA